MSLIKYRYKYSIRMFLFCLLILVLPVFIVAMKGYHQNLKTAKDSLKKEALAFSQRQNTFLSSMLKSVSLISAQLHYDKKYSVFYKDDSVSAILEIIDEFNDIQNFALFIDHLYYFDNMNDLIVGREGCYHLDFFSSVFKFADNSSILHSASQPNDSIQIKKITYYGQEAIAIIITSVGYREVKGPVFFFVVTDETFKHYLELEKDSIMKENIFFNKDLLYQFGSFDIDTDVICSFQLENNFSYQWSISKNEYRNLALQASMSLFLILLAIIFLGVMLIIVFIRQYYKPINVLLDYVESSPEGERKSVMKFQNEFEYLFRSYERLKNTNQEQKRDQLLYRLLYSKVKESDLDTINQYIEHGINLASNYYCFYLTNEKKQYEILCEKIRRHRLCEEHGLNITDKKFVIFITSDASLAELEQCNKEIKESIHPVYMSDITDNVECIQDCYSLAEQNMGHSQDKENNSYPIDELKVLSLAVRDSHIEKMLFTINRLSEAAEAADISIGNAIYYDVLKTITQNKDSVTLVANRFNSVYLKSRVQECCAKLSILLDEEDKTFIPAYRKKNLDEIKTYIKKNSILKNYSLKLLAYHFDTTQSNLSHYFKANEGITITEWTDRYKIGLAKEMLVKKIKIQDIAEQLGYSSPQSFSRVFKRYENILPKDYAP